MRLLAYSPMHPLGKYQDEGDPIFFCSVVRLRARRSARPDHAEVIARGAAVFDLGHRGWATATTHYSTRDV